MSLTFPNFNAAKNKAKEVLEGNLIVEPPVVAQKLAESYELDVRYYIFKLEYKEVAGFIDVSKNTIAVNGEDSPARQNFTIAHELGHYLLGHDLDGTEYTCLFRDPTKQKNTPIEQEANCFAANLLVPTMMLQRYLDRFSFADDEQLSRIFGVSTDVIRFRRLYL
ncbi:MAG: ImmA/IrrE family metallo-endopeptidase [Planctomycetaceae bacterium]|jgi:Zn-dependent peptidase ImmA (M78 family)|nr:ImmA/IrrE family metallo-endopeptidase [Planctomycetaceae bacterium]